MTTDKLSQNRVHVPVQLDANEHRLLALVAALIVIAIIGVTATTNRNDVAVVAPVERVIDVEGHRAATQWWGDHYRAASEAARTATGAVSVTAPSEGTAFSTEQYWQSAEPAYYTERYWNMAEARAARAARAFAAPSAAEPAYFTEPYWQMAAEHQAAKQQDAYFTEKYWRMAEESSPAVDMATFYAEQNGKPAGD